MKQIQIKALSLLSGCTFLPGSFDKRFMRDLSALPDKQTKELTEKQNRCLWKLVYKYRRQHDDKWFTAHAENLMKKWESDAAKETQFERPKLRVNFER